MGIVLLLGRELQEPTCFSRHGGLSGESHDEDDESSAHFMSLRVAMILETTVPPAGSGSSRDGGRSPTTGRKALRGASARVGDAKRGAGRLSGRWDRARRASGFKRREHDGSRRDQGHGYRPALSRDLPPVKRTACKTVVVERSRLCICRTCGDSRVSVVGDVVTARSHDEQRECKHRVERRDANPCEQVQSASISFSARRPKTERGGAHAAAALRSRSRAASRAAVSSCGRAVRRKPT